MPAVSRLGNWLHRSSNLKQAVGILFVTVLISNILGLARNVIIANRVGVSFGTIGPLDSYYAAFVLPDLFYNFIIVGALSSAVLPLLVRLDTDEDKAKFWQTFNVLISTGFVVIVLAMIILYIGMPHFIAAILPGFSQADNNLTVQLAKVLLLSPLFFTISQLSSSALQAKRFFLAPALAPIVYNVAIICGALLIPKFGLPVLVFGVIAGAAAHFLIQMPTLLRLGWRFQFLLKVADRHVREVIRLMIPRALALTGNQLLLVVFYRIASNFQEGSIAIYRLTDDLQTAPVLLLANTLAMAALPDFARHASTGQDHELRELIGKAMRLIFFIFLPATIFLLLFSSSIVELYISVGHSISAAEVNVAIHTFNNFVVSLFFQGAILVLARAFFARGNTVTPTLISLASVAIAWGVAVLISSSSMGVAGLSLAFSVASVLNATLLWIALKLPTSLLFWDSNQKLNAPAVILGSVIFTLVILITQQFSPSLAAMFTASPSLQNLIEILLALVLGSAFYLAWSRALSLEQWHLIRPRKISTTT